MNLVQRRARFRAILDGDRCVHPASVFDPISARIAEDLGFEVGMLAGSIASGTVLGAPDLVVLTLTEFAQQIQRICRAGDLSLMVDADHGYGNALNVMRTVEELETAGVSAMTIEDTVLPRSFGSAGREQMIPLEEGVGKMKAALAARQAPSMVIAGRTGALRSAGLAEAVRRVKAYQNAGVDALFHCRCRNQGGDSSDSCRNRTSLALGRWWRRVGGSPVFSRKPGADLLAGSPGVSGGGESGSRHIKGTAGGSSACRPGLYPRLTGVDGPGHPPVGL